MTEFEQEPQSTMSEREESQLPALDMLARLGYQVLTREQAIALRGGKASNPLLTDVLRERLPKINTIRYKQREVGFSAQNIRRAVQALEEVPLAQGLQHASEAVYDLLRLGKSFEQTVAGDTKSFTLRYVDWQTPGNNVFHVTPEYRMRRTASTSEVRLDLVCFVNGVPFVVIECKAPDVPLAEAIGDLLNYQRDEAVPELFKYVQVVLAMNRREAKYATIKSAEDFWAVWRDRPEEEVEEAIGVLLDTPLPADEEEALLANFVRERPLHYAVRQHGRRTATAQDRILYNLCRPARLLELTERFMLYDGRTKKIARYQQYYAVKRAMETVRLMTPEGHRKGGVIWHTQGSGKSLTMVLLANAIALSPEIENPRIVLVTDRVDLDKQLKTTFERCGLEPKRATSGAVLRRLIENKRATVITTLVQKFDAALKTEPFTDDSKNVFVLVDESHRTQYGTLSTRMRLVFRNACYLGFTGTPLLKKEKSETIRKFGGLIDAYSIDRAVEDKAVVPLLYEARFIEQEVQQKTIDAWFERICRTLSPKEQEDLKQKYSRVDRLSRAEQRLRMIAFDVSEHYKRHWQRDGPYYQD
ncbi:MAG: HsdR family type I site-specific deoxyribonuclease [Fibrella sp.]|nr:HsdR family type I site-specific deoxyribonuclease [Armatimonadota bacterium]